MAVVPHRFRRRFPLRVAVAGFLAGAGVLVLASGAYAARVAARPYNGPTNCAALHQRFGSGGPWTEIRFADLPDTGGSKTGRARGVTVTIVRTSPTTLDWQASDGIDLVWVNAGVPPNGSSAAYLYDPPGEATSDSGLSGVAGRDPLDHVLFCFDTDEAPTTSPTTAPATTTATTTATSVAPPPPPPEVTTPSSTPPVPTVPRKVTPATPAPPTTTATTPPATVRSVPQTSHPNPAPSPAPVPTPTPTSESELQLPETGVDAATLFAVGASLLGAGLVVLASVRRRPALVRSAREATRGGAPR
jgi:LPXTG-motif cell wall-anchored protein